MARAEDLSNPEVAGRVLKDDADAILERLEALRAIEQQKRHEIPTTPEYHELSERATQTAREVFAATHQEDVDRQRVDDAEDATRAQPKPPSAVELERRDQA